MSSVYAAAPVAFARASRRGIERPTASPTGRVSVLGSLRGRSTVHRIDHFYVARASADVVPQGMADLFRTGSGVPVEQSFRRNYHSGHAEAALNGTGIEKGLLHSIEPCAIAQSFYGDDVATLHRYRQ